jgi:hypothetical protein
VCENLVTKRLSKKQKKDWNYWLLKVRCPTQLDLKVIEHGDYTFEKNLNDEIRAVKYIIKKIQKSIEYKLWNFRKQNWDMQQRTMQQKNIRNRFGFLKKLFV